MATIVVHRQTGERYLRVGADHWALETRGQVPAAIVCDRDGGIRSFPAELVQVIEVDRKPPNAWLSEDPFR